jgi:hypothetical protein
MRLSTCSGKPKQRQSRRAGQNAKGVFRTVCGIKPRKHPADSKTMIPAIGYMIGAYVVARAAEMMELPKPLIRVLAGLSCAVALLNLGVLFFTEANVASKLPSVR